jgi:hypothetical protein
MVMLDGGRATVQGGHSARGRTRPSLRDFNQYFAYPALKRWAILDRPSGAGLLAITLRGGYCGLSRVVQAGGDAVHGGADGVVERGVGCAGPLAAQQVDLDQAERVDVWVAQAYGPGEDGVVLQ